MKNRFVVLVVSCLSLSACVSWRDIPQTGLDHPTRFSNEIRATAVVSFEYAQMAYNSYGREFQFDLGQSLTQVKSHEVDDIDFQYKIYNRIENGKLKEIVIAFRGTDSRRDVRTGSLSHKQNRAGLKLFDEIRVKNSDIKITVTGHSLGGGIASHLSLNRPNVDSFSFNSSPFFKKGYNSFKNDRNSIVEYGDPSKALRIFGREPTQLYTSINCTSGGLINQHASLNLAKCLTWMAAWDSEDALSSSVRNQIKKPDTRQTAPDRPESSSKSA